MREKELEFDINELMGEGDAQAESGENVSLENLFGDDSEMESWIGDMLEEDGGSSLVAAKPLKAVKPQSTARKALGLISELVFWVTCLALVFGSIMFTFSKSPDKNILGYRIFTVLTKSMEKKPGDPNPKKGGFKAGSLIITKMTSQEDIKVDDVITIALGAVGANNSNAFLTHRVIEVVHNLNGEEGLWFRTKGDANPDGDPPIPANNLMGKKVLAIPMVGSLMKGIKDHMIASVATLASIFMLVFLFKWFFSAPADQPQTSKAKKRSPKSAR